MADGRHFEKKTLNRHISATVNRLADFDKIWHNDAYWPLVADGATENARHEFAAPACTGGNCGT